MLTSYRQGEKIQDFYSGQSPPGGWIKAEKATFLESTKQPTFSCSRIPLHKK